MVEAVSRYIPDLELPPIEVGFIVLRNHSLQIMILIFSDLRRQFHARRETLPAVHQSIIIKRIIYPIPALLEMLTSIWNQFQQLMQIRMFSYDIFHAVWLNLSCFRAKAVRTVPLWGKVLMIAAASMVVIGAIVGPAVYFGLAGKFF